MIVPLFPLLQQPGDWDSLTLMAATIFLESQGEPEEGQLAVGWVIQTMAAEAHEHLAAAILGPD